MSVIENTPQESSSMLLTQSKIDIFNTKEYFNTLPRPENLSEKIEPEYKILA